MQAERKVPEIMEALAVSDHEEMAQGLCALVQESLEARYSLLWRWERGRAMSRGDHWGRLHRSRGYTTWEGSAPARTDVVNSRVTFNHIQKIRATKRAIYTQERIWMEAAASTSEGVDRAKSKVASGLLKYLTREHGLDDLYGDITDDAFDTGTGVLEVRWNAHRGREIAVEEADPAAAQEETYRDEVDPVSGATLQVLDREFRVPVKEKTRRAGALEFRLIPIESIVVPLGSIGLRSLDWLGIVEHVSLFEIADRYGSAVAKKVEVSAERTDDLDDGAHDEQSGAPAELVRVYRLFVRDCKKWPRGRMVVFTEGVILEKPTHSPAFPTPDEPEGMWPRWPFPVYFFPDQVDSRAVFGIGSVEPLIDPQMSLNGIESKKLLILKKLAHARVMGPKGALNNLDTDDFNSVLQYDRRHGVDAYKYLQPPQYPSELSIEARDKVDQMNDLSGINAALQGFSGQKASGVKDRQAIDRGLGRHAPTKARWDRVFADALRHALQLLGRYMEDETIVTIVGENDRVSVETFNSASLATTLDVYPVNNYLSSDPIRRVIELREFIQMTQQMEPTERARFGELLGLDSALFVQQEMNTDYECAQNENLRLGRGEPAQIEHWHNDYVHLAAHYAMGNTTEWINSVTPKPEDTADVLEDKQRRRQLFDQHVAEHMGQIQQKQPPAPAGPGTEAVPPSTATPQSGGPVPASAPRAPVAA